MQASLVLGAAMMMKKIGFSCLLSISFATTACSNRDAPVDKVEASARKEEKSVTPAPKKKDAPSVSSPSLAQAPKPRPVEEIKADRERLLHSFLDISPRAGAQPSQPAIAVFSKQGLAIGDAKIFIRRPGCILEVEQRGRRFKRVLNGFDHCRLGEASQRGDAQHWKLPDGKSRAVLVLDIKPNQEDPRCTTKLKTLRVTAQGPRLSKETSSNQMCSFRGFSTPFFDRLPDYEVAMDEVR